MEKIKFVVLVAFFAYAGYSSMRYIGTMATYYREMMTPEPEEKLTGTPVEGKFIALAGPVDPPTGKPRTGDEWDFELPGQLTTQGRATMSDVKNVYYFIPDRCTKCHDKEGPGPQFFHADNFMAAQDIKTDDGLVLRSHPEKGEVPTLKYVYKDRHLKKVPFDIGAPLDVYMGRGQ